MPESASPLVDGQAFDHFVAETTPAVWGLLRRLTATEQAAEEALQETYLAAWRGRDQVEDPSHAKSWLYGVARRQAARTWRRRAGEPRTTESLDELGLRAGWGCDPECAASRSEDRVQLLEALARLPDADQQVLARCDLEGMAPSELAEELGLAAGTVRVRLHRARLRLMGELREGGAHG